MRRWMPLLPVALLGGCRPAAAPSQARAAPPPTASPAPPRGSTPLRLVEITEAAGVRFQHHTGAFGRKWFPETNGSGAAIFDYDGDGFPDLFLVNGRDWSSAERRAAGAPLKPRSIPTPSRLFHNRGDGTFEDVTKGSGLDLPMYGMGCAVGDYDGDGDSDLYVTGVGRGWLFRNEAGGRFREVSASVGLREKGWGTSCAWFDADRDGRLDLFVCHYVDWRAAEDRPCSGADDRPIYCGPNLYPPEPCRLYLQKADGTFRDVSRAAGIWGARGRPLTSKAMGVTVTDTDRDGWPDLVVANDTEPNFLFRNRRNGTFAEEAAMRGIALPETGLARSGMGIDAADLEGTGGETILIGNFADEMLGLYRPEAGSLYQDVAGKVGVGAASRPFTTFGCLFSDLNNDGWLDIVAANGHIDDRMEKGNPVPLRQRPLFLLNERGNRFREARLYDSALVGRGLAAGDIDRDGDVDLLITANGGKPVLLRNDEGEGGSLRLVLEGTRGNRSAIGAEVVATLPGRVLRRRVRSGSSYLSASELPITLGVGKQTGAEVSVRWPNGTREALGTLSIGQEYRVREGSGVVGTMALREESR